MKKDVHISEVVNVLPLHILEEDLKYNLSLIEKYGEGSKFFDDDTKNKINGYIKIYQKELRKRKIKKLK